MLSKIVVVCLAVGQDGSTFYEDQGGMLLDIIRIRNLHFSGSTELPQISSGSARSRIARCDCTYLLGLGYCVLRGIRLANHSAARVAIDSHSTMADS